MKKIINGRKYDTETAKVICEYSNGLGYRDFGWMEETLYRKRTGEFFLAGEGGAASKYCEPVPGDINCYSNGSGIIPLDEDEAREWVETHMDADDYEALFGACEE